MPRHCCCHWCLHSHRSGAQWQHSGGGGCCNHALCRWDADALLRCCLPPPPSPRCRQAATDAAATAASVLPPASCRSAAANDATLPPRCQAGRRCHAIPASVATTLSLQPCYPHRRTIPITLLPCCPPPLHCYPAAAAATALPPPWPCRRRRCRAAVASVG